MDIGRIAGRCRALHFCASAVAVGVLSGCVSGESDSAPRVSEAVSEPIQTSLSATAEPMPSTIATSGASTGREVKLTRRGDGKTPQWKVRSGDVFAFAVTSDVRAELVVETAGDSAGGQTVTERAAIFPESRLVESIRLVKPGAYQVVALLGDSERRVIAQIDAM